MNQSAKIVLVGDAQPQLLSRLLKLSDRSINPERSQGFSQTVHLPLFVNGSRTELQIAPCEKAHIGDLMNTDIDAIICIYTKGSETSKSNAEAFVSLLKRDYLVVALTSPPQETEASIGAKKQSIICTQKPCHFDLAGMKIPMKVRFLGDMCSCDVHLQSMLELICVQIQGARLMKQEATRISRKSRGFNLGSLFDRTPVS